MDTLPHPYAANSWIYKQLLLKKNAHITQIKLLAIQGRGAHTTWTVMK